MTIILIALHVVIVAFEYSSSIDTGLAERHSE